MSLAPQSIFLPILHHLLLNKRDVVYAAENFAHNELY